MAGHWRSITAEGARPPQCSSFALLARARGRFVWRRQRKRSHSLLRLKRDQFHTGGTGAPAARAGLNGSSRIPSYARNDGAPAAHAGLDGSARSSGYARNDGAREAYSGSYEPSVLEAARNLPLSDR